jgi:membrane-associated PAP2 superfamily phosphatase
MKKIIPSSDNMKSIPKKRRLSKKYIFWIIILILLGLLVIWGLFKGFKEDEKFQKHIENEQNH